MSILNEEASIPDGLVCGDPDGARITQSLAKSSPATTTAAAAAADVELYRLLIEKRLRSGRSRNNERRSTYCSIELKESLRNMT